MNNTIQATAAITGMKSFAEELRMTELRRRNTFNPPYGQGHAKARRAAKKRKGIMAKSSKRKF